MGKKKRKLTEREKELLQEYQENLPDISEDDEVEFICCDHCDLPDACEDFGCAIENGVRRKPDNIF